MRDKRAIIIKAPRLQNIRNNLRLLWLKTVSQRWNELFDKMEVLERDSGGKYRSVDEMTSEERKKFREFQEEQSKLRDLANRSICKCLVCGKVDQDMVYNKTYDAWYCTECYGLERRVALKRVETRRQKREESCEERAISDHSKTFL